MSAPDDIAPVVYTVNVTHHWDGSVDVQVNDVGPETRDRKAVAFALRKAADLVESNTADVITKDLFN